MTTKTKKELLDEIEGLKSDLERALKPWNVIILVPSKTEPFGERCYYATVVDVGHADRDLIIESEEINSLVNKLKAERDNARRRICEKQVDLLNTWGGPEPVTSEEVAHGEGWGYLYDGQNEVETGGDE